MHFLIAYDIASPGRLRRVARLMEKHAIRVQKSVFVTDTTHAGMADILDQAAQIISPDYDIVQAWRLATDQPAEGQLRGSVQPVYPTSLVCDGARTRFIEPGIQGDDE